MNSTTKPSQWSWPGPVNSTISYHVKDWGWTYRSTAMRRVPRNWMLLICPRGQEDQIYLIAYDYHTNI